jgi:hypothetical protein
MSPDIKIYEDQKIIQRIVTGELSTARSLKLVQELAVAVKLNKGYGILIDLRDTSTRPEMMDLIEIANECSRHKYDFESKIAFLIPDTEQRKLVAKTFKICMEAEGFEFKQFLEYDSAMEWLSD